ncbi:MAG: hypothetical protein M0R03_23840 [Novosphingobium sp.]|nr:hypothetical protein [Novosphingobium sp.]
MVKGKLKMSYKRKILFAGTTSSGSSALFDYFRCFDNTCGMISELPKVWRKDLFIKWKKEKFSNTEKYKSILNRRIDEEAEKRFGDKLKDSTLLLNNVVTCLTLPGIELLDNTLMFCVLRDPRSTWLRRRELCLKHNTPITVQKFIQEYKQQRETFSYYLANLRKNKQVIHTIHFEDFLLDEEIKQNIVKLAGFDINTYPLQPKYMPYPKEKSILLHHYYDKQDEINLIKKELSEYCHAKV